MRAVNDKLVISIPDIHFPNEDKIAVEVVKKVVQMLRPRLTIQLGDALDNEPFSRHGKRKLAETFMGDWIESEVTPARELTDHCLKYSPKFWQLEGNHEERTESWCTEIGPGGMAAYAGLAPSKLLGDGRGKEWRWFPRDVQQPGLMTEMAPGLIPVHGWSAAAQAATFHLRRAQSLSVLFGHIHRKQSDSTRDVKTKKMLRAWSPGCLSKLEMSYTINGAPTQWSHGFEMTYVGSKSWTSYTVDIHGNSAVLPDGREVRV